MLAKKLLPAILWALFILVLCALPGAAIPDLSFLDWLKPDKLVHLFLFGVLCFFLIKAFTEQVDLMVLQQYPKFIAVIISSIYGVLIEILQEFCIPGRTGDVFDAMADSLGALIGIILFNIWRKRRLAR